MNSKNSFTTSVLCFRLLPPLLITLQCCSTNIGSLICQALRVLRSSRRQGQDHQKDQWLNCHDPVLFHITLSLLLPQVLTVFTRTFSLITSWSEAPTGLEDQDNKTQQDQYKYQQTKGGGQQQ